MTTLDKSIQDTFASHNTCYGCGPSNPDGLQIKSFPAEDDTVVLKWTPKPHHLAFPGVLNGGIIGSIMDCHCNWTAAYALMKSQGASTPPCTVTAEYTIRLLAPTPVDRELTVLARPIEIKGDRAIIEAKLFAVPEKTTATCRGTFVAVKPGHPAYHRW